jgi:magnesium-transporting ATPase (P-type)
MKHSPLHALRPAEVYAELEASPTGLSAVQVAERLRLTGPNTLSEAPGTPLWRALLSQLTHLMALLLLAAGLLAFLGRQPWLGLAIWGVVLVNAVFSFWQEFRAQKALEALRDLLPRHARVVREGREAQVPAAEVVPGDILVLAEGDNIPADARVVEEFGLRVNNTTLTGDAMPARRSAEASLREDLSDLEQPNLVFAGTSVVSGTGRAVTHSTGMATQFGRIVRLTQAVRDEPSPLQKEIRRLTRRISIVAVAVGVAVFSLVTIELAFPRFEAFLLAIGIIVAAVPEGLAPTITLTLAISVQRLAQKGVLVKKLAILETLGDISVICTDKSGTLTENQMTIRELWVGGERVHVSGTGYEPKGHFTPDLRGTLSQPDLTSLLTAATLCNNSRLIPPTPDRPTWTCLGDQTEAAMRALALKGGIHEASTVAAYPRIHEIPFEARRKRMSTVHRNEAGATAFVKGAPREVLGLCSRIQIRGEAVPLDDDRRAEILRVHDDFARRALRVLALARRDLPPRSPGGFAAERVEQDLTFLGLVGMMDPARPEVAGAIERFRGSGVRLIMITGDYGLTAESVARRIGMITGPQPMILTGTEVEAMSDGELAARLAAPEVIFARMAPDHKLRLVDCLQTRGEVVAVIGDGVNDAPALRKADVGIAMGQIGTDVAKEAADVIITNDNFAAIASAVEEGRAVYANLRKFITYIFASNIPEILPFLLTTVLHIPLALSVGHLLAIDLGTDLLPALALGAERPEPGIMDRPPRRRGSPLLDGPTLGRAFLWLGVLEAGLCYLGYGLTYLAFGFGDVLHLPEVPWLQSVNPLRLELTDVHRLATAVFLAGLVLAQVGNAYACRRQNGNGRGPGLLSNRPLVGGIAVELALLLAIVYVDPVRSVFALHPIPVIYWGLLALFAPAVYFIDRLGRRIWRGLRFARAPAGG